jgi:ATP-binding protein involved in chromosome partitioning
MIRKLNLNILGVVENYTGEVFGEGGGRKMAKEVDTPFLGTLALRSVYRDNSKPTVLLDQEVSREYAHLVKGLEKSLEELGREPR